MTHTPDTQRARQPKGSPTGGQYAPMDRAEADLDLNVDTPNDTADGTTIHIDTTPTHPTTNTILNALRNTPHLGTVAVTVRADNEHAAITAHITGKNFRISRYDQDNYRLWDTTTSAWDDTLIPADRLEHELAEHLPAHPDTPLS